LKFKNKYLTQMDPFTSVQLPSGELRVWDDAFANGTYATVHEGAVNAPCGSNHSVVVKVQRWSHETFGREINVQRELARMTYNLKDSAHVLPVYAKCVLFGHPAVVMPRAEGSVYQLLGKTESRIRRGRIVNRMVRQVARLLKTLQATCGFMHRDLHCSNVLYAAEGDPLTVPVSRFRFFLSDFGNATRYGDCSDHQTSPVLDGLQRRRYFTHFNAGLDLNTLLVSTREFLSDNMREISPRLREAILYFITTAKHSRTYTVDGQKMLQSSVKGQDLGSVPCNPLEGSYVPLFWFSYAGASALPLPKTVPAVLQNIV